MSLVSFILTRRPVPQIPDEKLWKEREKGQIWAVKDINDFLCYYDLKVEYTSFLHCFELQALIRGENGSVTGTARLLAETFKLVVPQVVNSLVAHAPNPAVREGWSSYTHPCLPPVLEED
jgi:hypothetical protein